jgi:hypothetical protein
MLNDCNPIKEMTLNNVNNNHSEPTIMNQTLLPASKRLKTGNLTKSSTKSHKNSYKNKQVMH